MKVKNPPKDTKGAWIFKDNNGSKSAQWSSTWFLARALAATDLGCAPDDLTLIQDPNKS